MTDRELLILDYLSNVRASTTKQIQDIFFIGLHHSVSYRVLNGLVDSKLINRKFYRIGNKNTHVYYLDKAPGKRNIDHDLLITEFYTQLIKNGYEIISFEKNPIVAGIIPDAEIWFKEKESDKIHSLFLEVQLSEHDCIKKYYNFSSKVKRDIPATLYIVSDKKINIQKLRDFEIILDDLEMKKIKETFKQKIASR